MKITVIGAGYVGLVSAVCFAKLGHQVVCVEKDKNKLKKLQQKQVPIFEPDLEKLLNETITSKKISFTDDITKAIEDSLAVFLAVGTPQDKDGNADLSFVFAAVEEIAKNAKNDLVIVTKSTVPVGTGEKISAIVAKANQNLNFSIVSNPEFLREGFAIVDFMKPDRIVVGVADEKAQKIMGEIYQPLQNQGAKILFCDVKTAELIKYAANSFLATKICFINEMADLCEKIGGDIKKLSLGIGLDSRIGEKFLNPGPGFGGSCFPKDISALLYTARENDVELSVVNSVIKSNDKRKILMVEKIRSALGEELAGKKIALLGLAFKANTDDIRYSPAIAIAKELVKNGVLVKASDEEAIENSKFELKEFGNIEFFADFYEAIKGSDLIVIATEWQKYRDIDLQLVSKNTACRKIVDLRNILNEEKVKNLGFEYFSIGKLD